MSRRSVRLLAALMAGGVAIGVVAALDPTTLRPGVWTRVYLVVLAVTAVAALLLLSVRRLARPGLLLACCVALDVFVLASVLANQSRSGALLTLMLLVPVTLWSATSLGSRLARAHALLVCAACAMAMWVIADSAIQWVSLTVLPSFTLAAATEVVLALRRSLETALRELHRAARTDPLTGLLNRRGLDEAVTSPQARFSAALAVDLDHFKTVNDAHGHATGDEVLRIAAGVLGSSGGTICTARTGGEEFVLLTQATDLPTLAAQGERLRVALRDALAPWQVTASIGAALLTPSSSADDAPTTPDHLYRMMRDADRGLYEAKRTGRDRVVVA